MKKIMMLVAAILAFQAVPVLADNHGGKKGEKFEMKDTNKDGVISKDEFLANAEKKFSEMDADGNGAISKEEAQAQWKDKKEKMKEKRKEMKEKWKEKRSEM